MKYILLFFLCLLDSQTFCQQNPATVAQLKIIEADAARPYEFTVKLHKRVKIRTHSGEQYTLHDYSLLGDSVIASQADTILLRDIAMFKGSVRGDVPKKVLGWTMIGTGMVASFYGTAIAVIAISFGGSGSLMLIPLAAYGWTFLGAHLVEYRSFNTRERWTPQIVLNPAEDLSSSPNGAEKGPV